MINTCFVLPLQVARRLNDKQFYSTLYEAEFVNFSESSNEISVARYSEVKAGDGSQASKACKIFLSKCTISREIFQQFSQEGLPDRTLTVEGLVGLSSSIFSRPIPTYGECDLHVVRMMSFCANW